MKGRRVLVAVLATTLALVAGLVWFLWPRQSDSPLCLKIVGQTMENLVEGF